MWIRTKDGWYIYRLQGALFVSFISEADKANADFFPVDKVEAWLELLTDMTGKELEAVEPFV